MANVTNLSRNTGSRVLSYPSDVTGGATDHYVMFSINVQQKSKIDFGGTAMGDPACDLVIAWTYLSGKARDIFINTMDFS